MTTGIHHRVAEHAAARPQQEAVVDSDGRTMTYESLWRRSGELAATLADLGVGPGARVAVALDRSLDLVVALLGVARTGAAYVPLDLDAPARRISFVLAETGARVVLGGPTTGRWPVPAGTTWLSVDATAGSRTPTTARSATPTTGGSGTSAEGGSGMSAVGGSGTPAGVGPIAPVDPEDPLYLAYTSGSTGQPKACVIPHRAVLRLVTRPVYCSVGPGDRVANVSSPAFDATTFEVWGTLAAGATLVVLPPVVDIAAGSWPEVVRDHRLSTMFLTTALFSLVAQVRPDAFGALDTLLFGGETVDPGAVRRVLATAPPRRLVHVYGPTETTTFATFYDCTPDSVKGLERIPIGLPVQDTTLHVLDEHLRPVPPGQTGELCIGGPGVALGYLDRPELTAQRFRPERDLSGPGQASPAAPAALTYRTGDLVRQRADGTLDFLGRIDRQVKLRGLRIELEEVERAIMSTGLVTGAVVEKVGQGLRAHLAAVITPAATGPEPAVAGNTVADALRERLPSYMVPARWVVRGHLPVGPTGKVDRQRLLAELAMFRN